MTVYLTCPPRHISNKGSKLAKTILDGKEKGNEFDHSERVAKALFKSAESNPEFCRSAALIARSTVEELFWADEHLSAALQDVLVDLVTSNFVTTWTKEFNRGTSSEYETWASQQEDERFKQSNPRPDDSALDDLYLDETDTATYRCDKEKIAELDQTPTLRTPVLPAAHESCHDPSLRSASILLGDFYAIGFIHPEILQTCILYLVDNLCHSVDLECLYAILDRATTHLASRLPITFLRTCKYKIILYGMTRFRDEAGGTIGLLTLIDELIDHEKSTNNGSGALYAQRACHRWDSVIVDKITLN